MRSAAAVVAREVKAADEWNSLVLGLPGADLRQGFEWGEVRASVGWEPHRAAVFRGDTCQAAMSVLAGRGAGVSVLYAPSGPILRDPGDRDAADALIEWAKGLARRRGAAFLRVNPKVPNEAESLRDELRRLGFVHLPDDWTTWNDPRVVMSLDVSVPEEEIRRRIHKRVRSYIKRAVSLGAVIEHDTSTKALRDFYALLLQAGRRKRLPVREIGFFEQLRQHYLLRGNGTLLLARAGGTALGSVLLTRFGDHAYFLHAGIDTESSDARAFHAGPGLYWNMIGWARAAGCRAIDMGGSSTRYPPRGDEPGYGVYYFKSGLGAKLIYLTGYYDLPIRRGLYRAFRLTERRLLPLAWKLRARLNREAGS
jgi:peptidoglycan pentaglycine glycine transferase (the first glycine)